MTTLATDLTRWLEEPPPAPELADLAAVGEELRQRAAPHVDAATAADRLTTAARVLSERLEERLAPTTRFLAESFPNFGSVDGGWLTSTVGTTRAFGEPIVQSAFAVGGTLREYADFDPLLLRFGGLVELLEHARVRVGVAISLGHQETLGGGAEWIGETVEAPVESIEAERLTDAAADKLVRRLPEWAREFADRTA
jgi:hypothetical protein